MVTPVRETRLELDGLFPPQTEGLLQFETHPHVEVTNLLQILCGDLPGFRYIGHELSIRNTVVVIRPRDDILPVDLLRPPTDNRHPVLDGTDGYIFTLPPVYQCLHVLRFQRLRVHFAIAQSIELVGDQCQLAVPDPPVFCSCRLDSAGRVV